MEVRFEELPERRVVVAPHPGGLGSIDETRRPLYQHLIMQEAVGGPSMLRFRGPERHDVLVAATPGYLGSSEFPVEELPGGRHAVVDYEGPEDELPAFRQRFLEWLDEGGHRRAGDLLQVHLMDPLDGVTEQQLQVRVEA